MAHIQIRDVPEDLHRQLRERAAAHGKSLSAYLLEELLPFAAQPTMAEWIAEIRAAGTRPSSGVDIAAMLKEEHEERDRRIIEAATRSR
ncbi:MAG: FitA-like ribbon-helix-helix domain-containing protein [Solirubrobacteraceae bacterium]